MEKQPAHLMIGIGQIFEVGDHFIGIQAGFKHLGARRQRQRIETAKFAFGKGAGFNRQQGAVDALFEFVLVDHVLWRSENPLQNR